MAHVSSSQLLLLQVPQLNQRRGPGAASFSASKMHAACVHLDAMQTKNLRALQWGQRAASSSRWKQQQRQQHQQQRQWVVVQAQREEEEESGGNGKGQSAKPKISFADQLLDYIEAGPKMRKWYGAPDQLPKDGQGGLGRTSKEQPEEEEDETNDAVLVTDGESEIGQFIVLELILKQQQRVKALVKDVKKATAAFGPYVQPIAGDVSSPFAVDKALRGVTTVVVPSQQLGVVLKRAKSKGVGHIVFLSEVGVSRPDAGGLAAFFGRAARQKLLEAEAAVESSGIPYTIVRLGQIEKRPGRQKRIIIGQDDSVRGKISAEDAAEVCVAALETTPRGGIIFEAVNGESDGDLSFSLDGLQETASKAVA